MGIKRYILLTLIYMIAVGLYVYSFNGELYTLELFGLSLNMPIAVWVIVPVILLFVATIIHLVFYNFKDFLHQRALKKDFETFKEVAKLRILSEKGNGSFKTEGFKAVGDMLSVMKFDANADVTLFDTELAKAHEVARSIHSGNYEDLKKYKLAKENP